MSLPLVRKIGPEDSIKTVTTQFCLFHLFLFLLRNYYSLDVGKLTANYFLYFELVEKRKDSFPFFGGLAQLARAPALQAGGQGFDSLILHSSRRRDVPNNGR